MSTNYYDTFIEVADDCPVSTATIPQSRGAIKTVAVLQYEMIADHPYEFTQDDILFAVFAERQGIRTSDRSAEREKFFARDQPCLRSSSLGKRYGWGIHNDDHGRVALFAVDSGAYRDLMDDDRLKHLKALRSRRA
jgi:hypothetical protein